MTVNADLEREKGHGHERNPPLFYVVSQAELEAATHPRKKQNQAHKTLDDFHLT
jgi:hypothetical protein